MKQEISTLEAFEAGVAARERFIPNKRKYIPSHYEYFDRMTWRDGWEIRDWAFDDEQGVCFMEKMRISISNDKNR